MNLQVLILFQFVATFMYLEKVEARSPRLKEHKFEIKCLHDDEFFHLHTNGKVKPVSDRPFGRTFLACSKKDLNKQIYYSDISETYQGYEFEICAENSDTKLYMHQHYE